MCHPTPPGFLFLSSLAALQKSTTLTCCRPIPIHRQAAFQYRSCLRNPALGLLLHHFSKIALNKHNNLRPSHDLSPLNVSDHLLRPTLQKNSCHPSLTTLRRVDERVYPRCNVQHALLVAKRQLAKINFANPTTNPALMNLMKAPHANTRHAFQTVLL